MVVGLDTNNGHNIIMQSWHCCSRITFNEYSAGLSIGRLRRAPRDADKLDLPDFLVINFVPSVSRGPLDLLRSGPEMSFNQHWMSKSIWFVILLRSSGEREEAPAQSAYTL
ncbi:hypothetical protein TNCV_3854511 [Trichonephila clavipes]|nr:hypothetical protein TNCV_3854511 [Trichonephila clavipes]